MKTKTAKTKTPTQQKPAAAKIKSEHQKPQEAQAHDGTPDHTPEPPQMMHPLSSEERERKKDESR
jgi:hypothetical protein